MLKRVLGVWIVLLLWSHSAVGQGLGEPMARSEARAGTLLFRTESGLRPAPALETDVQIGITGMIARTKVEQNFENTTSDWVEAVYVFPLPEGAAVDTLALIVGERLIVGEIQEREAARKIYEQAKRDGKKASLLEQERPNLFTTSVTGIGPGESVRVAIEYQEDVQYDQGRFSLRFPMVVGPRYIPGAAAVETVPGTGWAHATDAVPDAHRITPPVALPSETPINPVRIRVELDSGIPLARIHSVSHAIESRRVQGTGHVVELTSGRVPADSDFVLEWVPAASRAPVAALFHEEHRGEHFALMMVMPPLDDSASGNAHASRSDLRVPRETIFVIDTSGSMHGPSMAQAKSALRLALERLRPFDRFNVIAFDSVTQSLFATAMDAEPANVERARRWVDGLRAEGGTEMLDALRVALEPEAEGSRLRQVIFITDGAIGNEAQLFREIRSRLGRSRLFTIGIGSAPNSHFMARAAEFGRGTSVTISDVADVRGEMDAFFAKLESPILQDIRLRWDGGSMDVAPVRIPDLYRGEPVLVTARMPRRAGTWTIEGMRGRVPWHVELAAEGGSARSGIARLWARRKIQSLMGTLSEGARHDDVRAAVLSLGLEHHLVTKFTSLVAVDVTPTGPPGVMPDLRVLPTNLPRGWSYEHIFGAIEASRRKHPEAPFAVPQRMAMNSARLPQGGTPSMLLFLMGVLCLSLAAIVWRRTDRVAA